MSKEAGVLASIMTAAIAVAVAAAAMAAATPSEPQPQPQDCGPCSRSPWVPVAMGRALRAQQVALTVPTIHLTLPVAQVLPPSIPPMESLRGGGQPHRGQQGGPVTDHSQLGLPLPPPPQRFNSPFKPYRPPQAQHDSASNPSEQKYLLRPQPAQALQATHGAPDQPRAPPNDKDSGTKDQLPSTSNDNPTGAKPVYPPPSPQAMKNYQPTPQQPHNPPQNFLSAPIPIGLRSNPLQQKYFPPPNYQFLPSVKFGPPFDIKAPTGFNLFSKPQNSPASTPTNGARPMNPGAQQYRDPLRRPVLIEGLRPIAFPTASKTQLPPLFGYQPFNGGPNDQPRPYLEPPKPQNVVLTIVESDNMCKQCQENTQKPHNEPQKNSDTDQAEQVTESVTHTTRSVESSPKGHSKLIVQRPDVQKPSVHIVKSVPLAEYLASVEYPMQIVQAPILDVPDLTKYFNLGYNLPQTHHYNHLHIHDQNPSPTFIHPNKQNSAFQNEGLRGQLSGFEHNSQANLDNVEMIDTDAVTTAHLPHNHKINHDLEKNHISTVKPSTSHSPLHHSSSSVAVFTTRPSQIFHISKASPVTHSAYTTVLPTSVESFTTISHHVTSRPPVEMITEQQLSSTSSLIPDDPIKSAQEDQSTGLDKDSNPSDSSHLRFINPPPLGSGAVSDWSLPAFGRGWGNPPKPFTVPASDYRPRFSARPLPALPAKKGKHIHQIIIPYTTNKQPPVLQEPKNHVGWTPVPPTNQGRKVPADAIFENKFPLYGGTYNILRVKEVVNKTLPENSPERSRVEGAEASRDAVTVNDRPLDLPPHVINQILQLNKQGTSDTDPLSLQTGPDELQQLLATNLQGLLRGEEDSIDFARLQKNIDNWTAEGYKQNSPPVHFVPVTTTSHIFNSKKIPDEYLRTEPTTINSTVQDAPKNHQNFNTDREGAASQKYQVSVSSDTPEEEGGIEDTTDDIQTLLKGWSLSLLDTKVTETPPSSSSTEAWERTRVSISPLTKEKVYVVTPEPTSQ